jgi:hypothetical protein
MCKRRSNTVGEANERANCSAAMPGLGPRDAVDENCHSTLGLPPRPRRSLARASRARQVSARQADRAGEPPCGSLSINQPPRPDGPAAYNIEKRFSGTCRSLGALSSPLRRRSFSRPMPSLGESTRRESAGFRLHFRRRDYQTCPASEDALRAEDADANGRTRRASGALEPTNRTVTVVGQEKLSCISDNGRFRHRR